MPLMPATRPLNSNNSATALPIIPPPTSADSGVKCNQSTVMASPPVPGKRVDIKY
ncbi:hypothetical protein D3C80_377560 [compost metagenome]